MLAVCLLSSCAGATGTSASSSFPSPTVTVAPSTATVSTGDTAQFTATVQNASSNTIQWEVDHVPGGGAATGTINSTGMYLAPSVVPAGSVEITAVLEGDTSRFGSATVTVVAPLYVSPREAELTTSQAMQFQAAGSAGGAGVNWSATAGTVTAGGSYTPPAGAAIATVTATSRSDSTVTATATVYVTDLAGTLSWRNDAGLTGQNRRESALSPATLSAGLFAKLSSCPVDGQIYAQPLYVANVAAGGSVRNLVLVATEHDSIYAFDADAIPCEQVWKTSFLEATAGISSVPAAELPGSDITPEVGITGTPVIDRASGTLYAVAKTKESTVSGPSYVQRLHALDIATGSEKSFSPVTIVAGAPGTGDGSNGRGAIPFDAFSENQRAGLQLAVGKVYVAFTGHDPSGSYHGWLLVYDAATLTLADTFNTTPNASKGGVEAAPSVDAAGSIYVVVGHGGFDAGLAPSLRADFGQTLLKLQPPPLALADASKSAFTPFNQAVLSGSLDDLGASGAVLLPDQLGAPNPHLAAVGATDGTLYLLNRDDLGGFASSAPDHALKTLELTGEIRGTPAYWQGTLYVAAAGDPVTAFPLTGGSLADAPSSQSSGSIGGMGASPVVSSNGGSGGVVWVLDTSGAHATPAAPAVLHSYDADNLSHELYSSAVRPEDAAGPAVSLAVPTVANGHVYVGTQDELTVYGLVP
jgi:hypothetical protein